MMPSSSYNQTGDLEASFNGSSSKVRDISFGDLDSTENLHRKDVFKGKALSTGERCLSAGRQRKKVVKNDKVNTSERKYTVKEFTFHGERQPENQLHVQEIDDIFPDDISDRLHLFDRIPRPPPKSVLKTRPSRTQSAKAKLISESKQSEDLSKALVLKDRPSSAHVVGLNSNDNEKPLEPHVWKYDCKESPRKAASTGDLSANVPEPIIFGYKYGRLISGEPANEPKHELQEVTQDEKPEEQSNLPKCLRPFLPWQVHGDIPHHWIGIDPAKCVVLCPSLLHQVDDLPTVPPKQQPEEELDYIEKISPIVPTRKYTHPWNKLPLPEHKCTHIPSARLPSSARVRIYNMEGNLLHETYHGTRTADVVRKEIQELEDLMQGRGSHDGCLFVQYQAEITDMQNMLDRMCGRIQEIDRREEEKRRRAETPDYFGLRSFYKEHDSVMARIKQQHELCVVELAALEGTLDMNTQHFTKQLMQ